MAERKTGPVKPPTIDLTARSADKEQPKKPETEKPAAETTMARPETIAPAAGAGKPDAKPAEKKAAPSSASHRPEARTKLSLVLAAGIVGAIAGGVLGLAAAYGLALFGYWPGSSDTAAIAALSDEVKSLYVKKSDIGGVVDRSVGEVSSEVANLKERVSSLETAIPRDPAPDLSVFDSRIGVLETRLGELGQKLDAAVIGGGDPAAEAAVKDIGTRLDTLSAALSELESGQARTPDALAALETSLQAVRNEVDGLAANLSALANAPAPEPVDLRLPLALDGLSDALETGAGFAGELALIQAALPDLAIPAEVTAAAATGLGAPAALQERFTALVPDLLAAKPIDRTADWTGQVLDRLKALIALRPVATSDSDTPEALVSRIEAALAAHEYAVASAAFAALPEPMRAAADGIDRSVGQFAALSDLIGRARAAALALAGAQT